MDNSKKRTKRSSVVLGKKEVEVHKAISFIERSLWPGKKVELGVEGWNKVMRFFFSRAENVFKHLSGFVPIKHLINNSSFITDIDKVKFSGDIDWETRCHELERISIKEIRISELERYEKNEVLLITRNQKLIVWHQEFIKTFSNGTCKYVSESAAFEVIPNAIPFLKKGGIDVYSLFDTMYLWIGTDLSERREQLKEEERIHKIVETMRENVRQVAGS